MQYKNAKKYYAGFTLYYAVLVGSLILVIGASMLNLSLKELTLTGTLKESELAFFAADAGTECALYWDLRGYVSGTDNKKVFPASNDPSSFSYNGDVSQVKCNGNTSLGAVFDTTPPVLTDWATTTFSYNVNDIYCTVIRVVKHVNVDGTISTAIQAKGYNMAGSGTAVNGDFCINNTSARRVERSFVTQY
jgi:hypothetical protein